MFKLQFLENSFCNIFNYPVYLAHKTIVLQRFARLFALLLYIVFVFVYYYSTIFGEKKFHILQCTNCRSTVSSISLNHASAISWHCAIHTHFKHMHKLREHRPDL